TGAAAWLGSAGATVLRGPGSAGQWYSAGHARLLAECRFVGGIPGGCHLQGAVHLAVGVTWRCRLLRATGPADQLPGGALQGPPGDLGRAPAVPAARPARPGHCPDPGVLRPALRAGAVPDHGTVAAGLCTAVPAAGPVAGAH